jgi:hypothetical protein
MRPTTLARAHWRSATRRASWPSLPLLRKLRTRTLKDRLPAFGHNRTRRRCRGSRWTGRRGIHRSRPSLRNNQPSRRRRCRSLHHRRRFRRRSRCLRCDRSRCFSNQLLRWGLWNSSSRNGSFLDRLLRCSGLDLHRHRWLRFNSFNRYCRFYDRGRCGRCRRFGSHDRSRRSRWLRRNNHRSRRTSNGLRSYETGCRLRRLNRGHRRCAGGHNRRLRSNTRRTGRHRGSRRYARARRNLRSNRTWRRDRLCGLLRNRFQDVARLGDVRQVNLGLELFLSRIRSPTRCASCFAVFRVVLPHELRFVHLDGAGVRLLLRDPNHGEDLEYHLCFNFELSRQIVNTNLLQHSALFPP